MPLSDFLSAMEKGTKIEPNLGDGMKGMQILEAAVMSSATGQKVSVSEIQ